MFGRNTHTRVLLTFVLLVGVFGSAVYRPVAADDVPAPTTTESSTVSIDDSVDAAIAYLATQQLEDGAIDSFGSGADATGTALTVLALAANGRSVTALDGNEGGPGLLDYLATEAVTYTHQPEFDDAAHVYPSRAGLLLAAVASANQDVSLFGGMDLVGQLVACYDEETGVYSSEAEGDWTTGAPSEGNQTWAILGLAAAGEAIPGAATDYLIGLQGEDGSWAAGDPDTTARALVALLASGNVSPVDDAIIHGLSFFSDTALETGGWRPAWDTDPVNADTTGWVLQALTAAGYVPTSSFSGDTGVDPVAVLQGLQQEDGRIGGTYANAYSTAEALLGLADRSVCFLGRNVRAQYALSWLAGQQNEDGSWAGFAGADPGATSEVVLALAAAGIDPASVAPSEGLTPIDSLAAEGPSYAETGPAAAGKLAVAMAASGLNPRDIGGMDVIDLLATDWYSPTLGGFGTITDTQDTWAQCWAIMGLVAAGEDVPAGAVDNLRALQADKGNWTDAWGYSAPDSTGLALQALSAAGLSTEDPAVAAGVAYLSETQDARGGWENANSTAAAIQGLLAVGEDVLASPWLENGSGPFEALASFQKADGPFVWMWDSPYGPPRDDAFATRQAIPALLGVSYPFVPGDLESLDEPASLADPDRLLADAPVVIWDEELILAMAFAGDLDGNAVVALDYREVGATDWITGTVVVRSQGLYTSTLSLGAGPAYEVAIRVSDPDGVQRAGEVMAAVEEITEIVTATEEPTPAPVDIPIASAEATVGLVVQLGPDQIVSLCVPMVTGEEMTGLDVLMASGLDVAASYSTLGVLVCAIEDVGCPEDDCFCESGKSWSYWHLEDGEWAYSAVGANGYTVKAGDVEGWRWGETQPPEVLSFAEICAAEAAKTPEPVEPPAEPTETPETAEPQATAAEPAATSEPAATEDSAAGAATVSPTEATPPSDAAGDSDAGVPVEYVIAGLLVVALGVVLVVVRRRRAS